MRQHHDVRSVFIIDRQEVKLMLTYPASTTQLPELLRVMTRLQLTANLRSRPADWKHGDEKENSMLSATREGQPA